MNKKIFTICVLMLLYTFQGCQNSETDQKLLQEEVMKTHDVLMGDMETLMKNKTALAQIKENLNNIKQKNAEIDTFMLKKGIEDSIADLVAADDAMMTWMNNFNPDYTDKSDLEIITYLNDQKMKINTVERLFKTSIAKSNDLLIKYK